MRSLTKTDPNPKNSINPPHIVNPIEPPQQIPNLKLLIAHDLQEQSRCVAHSQLRQDKGQFPRFGPEAFPSVDFGETLVVPTPAEAGDGKAINDFKSELRSGMRSSTGTMSERDEALAKGKDAALTTV